MSRAFIISGIIYLLLALICAALQDNVRDNKSQRHIYLLLIIGAAFFDALAIISIIIGIIYMIIGG